MCFCAFSASILLAAFRSARSLCEYTMSCSWHAASNELIPWSPLENRVPWPQNWYLCSSKGNAFVARFNKPLDDICCNSLSKAPDRRYTFDDSVNRNASGTNGIIPPNLLVYVLVVYTTIDLYNFSNSRSSTIFDMYSSSFEVKLWHHPTRRGTFWLLIDFALRGSIHRSAISFSVFCGKRKYMIRASVTIIQSDESCRQSANR